MPQLLLECSEALAKEIPNLSLAEITTVGRAQDFFQGADDMERICLPPRRIAFAQLCLNIWTAPALKPPSLEDSYLPNVALPSNVIPPHVRMRARTPPRPTTPPHCLQ